MGSLRLPSLSIGITPSLSLFLLAYLDLNDARASCFFFAASWPNALVPPPLLMIVYILHRYLPSLSAALYPSLSFLPVGRHCCRQLSV